MNVTTKTVYVLIFIVFLSAGLWSGSWLGDNRAVQSMGVLTREVAPLPTPATGQQNVLVIGVDRLGSLANPIKSARLVSIWLVIYFPGRPFVSLVPIYPNPSGEHASRDRSLAEANPLTPEGTPSRELVHLLRQHEIWWSGYVLVDEIGMIEIIDFLGGVESSTSPLSGALAVGSIPRPWDDSIVEGKDGARYSTTIRGQSDLLKQLCQQVIQLPSVPSLEYINGLMPDHLRTDLDTSRSLQEARLLLSGESKLTCKFPLEASAEP